MAATWKSNGHSFNLIDLIKFLLRNPIKKLNRLMLVLFQVARSYARWLTHARYESPVTASRKLPFSDLPRSTSTSKDSRVLWTFEFCHRHERSYLPPSKPSQISDTRSSTHRRKSVSCFYIIRKAFPFFSYQFNWYWYRYLYVGGIYKEKSRDFSKFREIVKI